jgi:CPA2 family monovalent cation:H+ antiporter-2
VVRTHSDQEAELLRQQAGRVFMGEHELATGMAGYVLERLAGSDRR